MAKIIGNFDAIHQRDSKTVEAGCALLADVAATHAAETARHEKREKVRTAMSVLALMIASAALTVAIISLVTRA